jgi:NAD(P)-dependent dehydrogenase (short-subunit alcohol dehydrogenase family)
MASTLEGTVALVTGASSGIGAATARQLSATGAAVALAARRKQRLETLAAEIGDAGGTALVIECDVTKQEEATEAVEHTVSELGRLDTLVNNAGVMLLGPAVDAPLSEWQRMVPRTWPGHRYFVPPGVSPRRNRQGTPNAWVTSDGSHHGTWPLLDNPIGPDWAVSGGHRHLRFSPQTERLPSDERDFRCGTFAAHRAVGGIT